MAFLDNSGDIILDAVLTDAGRKRLAQGDGSFRIAKFALGDDEIDYGLFNKSHASGSAYYDLEIMQTPVLEAFTNNTSLLKHKLMSMTRTNLLYLPEMNLNYKNASSQPRVFSYDANGDVNGSSASSDGTGVFVLAADAITLSTLNVVNKPLYQASLADSHIRVDQGMNTMDIAYTRDIDSDLKESQYILQADHRMLRIVQSNRQGNALVESFLDDDMQASYYLTESSNSNMIDSERGLGQEEEPTTDNSIILGPFGTKLVFNLRASDEISTSSSLFLELGGGSGSSLKIDSVDYYYIDTNVRVTGATTGSSVDIPVRILKKQ